MFKDPTIIKLLPKTATLKHQNVSQLEINNNNSQSTNRNLQSTCNINNLTFHRATLNPQIIKNIQDEKEYHINTICEIFHYDVILKASTFENNTNKMVHNLFTNMIPFKSNKYSNTIFPYFNRLCLPFINIYRDEISEFIQLYNIPTDNSHTDYNNQHKINLYNKWK